MPPINVEVTAQVNDAVRGLQGVNGQFDLMKQANRDAAGALGVFGVSLTALNSPLTAIASGIKDSIDTAEKWGETIDKLSRASGQNAEQTSKMAVVLGDYGINVESLDKVVKTFTKNGLQFNLETLKDLAKQYQAIQDPVERDKFAFDNFGRSALDMTEILSKTPDELNAIGNAAMYSGKIMNEQGVEAAQNFGVKIAQLNDKLDGLKIAVGGPLIDGLTSAIGGFQGLTGVVNLLSIKQQLNMGIMTQQEAAIRATAAASGDLWAANRKLTDSELEQLHAELNLSDGLLDRLKPALTDTTDAFVGMVDNVSALTSRYPALNEGERKLAEAASAAAAALVTQGEQMALSAGLSGTITKAETDYAGVIDGNKSKIADLTAELDKYQAAQGEVITTTTKGSATQQDYETAVTRLQIAQERLNESHSKSQATIDSLNLSVQLAQQRVDDLSGKMGGASTVTADYTTKINEDKAALDELNGANAAAADAIAKTTGQFIYQQEAALIKDPALLLELAHSLGLIDEKSYNLSLRVQDLTHQWDLNHNGMIDTKAEADGLAGALHAQQLAVEYDAGVIPVLTDHIGGLGGNLHHAGDDAYFLAGGINAIPTSHTTDLYVIHHETTLSNNGNPNDHGAGAAGGADFTVPPGYPNDSYPLRVQSGEHVVVTPAPVTNNYSYTVNAAYGGSTGPGAIASELKLMSKLNR